MSRRPPLRTVQAVGLVALFAASFGAIVALSYSEPLAGTLVVAALLALWGLVFLLRHRRRRERAERAAELAALLAQLEALGSRLAALARRHPERPGELASDVEALLGRPWKELELALLAGRAAVGPALSVFEVHLRTAGGHLREARRAAARDALQAVSYLHEAERDLARARADLAPLAPYWESLKEGRQRGRVTVALPE